MNLKEKHFSICKIYYPKVSKRNNENFSDCKCFPFAAGVNDMVVHLELRISPQIFEKILNGPNGISGAWGKLIHVENLKSKISWHCPFNFPRLKKGIWNNAQYAVEASGSLYKNNCLVSKASIAYLCIVVRIQIHGSVPLIMDLDPVPDPDPANFVIDLQDANKKYFFKVFLLITF